MDDWADKLILWMSQQNIKINGKIINNGNADKTSLVLGILESIFNTEVENRPEALRDLFNRIKAINGGGKPVSLHLARDAAEFVWKQEKRI